MVFMYLTKFRAVKVRFFAIGIIIFFLIMNSGIAYSHDPESNGIEGDICIHILPDKMTAKTAE